MSDGAVAELHNQCYKGAGKATEAERRQRLLPRLAMGRIVLPRILRRAL
jgi:hypothetical protein